MSDLSIVELRSPPDDFLPDEPEGAAFHNAFLAARITGFDCRYLAIFKNKLRIAVLPFFLHTFSIGTMLPDGLLKKCIGWIKFRYVCVGHPSTDFGKTEGELSDEILSLVNTTLANKATLVAYKGFNDQLSLPDFVRVRGLPVAVLRLKCDYFSMLNRHRRNDFRHKLKAASTLRFEEYDTLPDHLLVPLYQLYLDTLNRAPVQFETLTPEYFRSVSGLGRFHLYFEGEHLIGFLQIIFNGHHANLKYMGMDSKRNRRYFLYFVMCLKGIAACQSAGCIQIELGASSYHAKRLMGCELIETSLYFRHNHRFTHWLLEKCKFLLEPNRDDLS